MECMILRMKMDVNCLLQITVINKIKNAIIRKIVIIIKTINNKNHELLLIMITINVTIISIIIIMGDNKKTVKITMKITKMTIMIIIIAWKKYLYKYTLYYRSSIYDKIIFEIEIQS